jgi:hypothetical protein
MLDVGTKSGEVIQCQGISERSMWSVYRFGRRLGILRKFTSMTEFGRESIC